MLDRSLCSPPQFDALELISADGVHVGGIYAHVPEIDPAPLHAYRAVPGKEKILRISK